MIQKEGKEEVYLESGYADLENRERIRRDHIFRLFSMTKPITATAMMLLMERGLVDLADPVSRYLPGFQNQRVMTENGITKEVHREVTVMDLMNMTSGLIYGGEAEPGRSTEALFSEVIEGLEEGHQEKIDTVCFANRLGRIPLAFHPGESWCYGTSADVAGAIVEIVSGMRFGDFLKQELFVPLHMEDTDFWVPQEKQKRLARAYDCEEGKESILYTGNNLGIRNTMDRRPSFESGGAGLVSTIDDYANFAQMLLQEGSFEQQRILQPASVQYLTGHVLNPRQQKAFEQWINLEGFSYGNFMRVLVKPSRAWTLGSVGEYGWDGWLGCYFANAPEQKRSILLMTQKKDAGTFALTRKLRNVIYSA